MTGTTMQAQIIDWGAGRSALMLGALYPAHRSAEGLLWLRLESGSLRAFRLPLSACNAAAMESLAGQCELDPGGKVLVFSLESATVALHRVLANALYAAPASPIASTAAWTACARWLAWSAHAGAVVDATFATDVHALPDTNSALGAALLCWSQSLDAEVLRVLSGITGDRVYASCRNYTRLMLATPTLRRNRLQALERYPNQLAHVLISPHHGYDLHGGSAHAWRLHDQTLQTAVDEGGSLLEALAQSSQVDKSVFKAPALHASWPTLALSRANLLQVLQGMPPTARPVDGDLLVQAQPLWHWIGHHDLTDIDTLRAVGAGFLRKGIEPVLARLQQWADEGTFAWADLDDFVRQVDLWDDLHCVTGPNASLPRRALLRAWVCQRGLWDLHRASQRWHEELPGLLAKRRLDALQVAQTLQTPLRQARLEVPGGLWQAELLETAEALGAEGAEMKHCVASYWSECVEEGSRIFSVRTLTCPAPALPQDTPRVTAQYRLERLESGYDYVMAQVRGYRNRPPDAPAMAASRALCDALNTPEAADLRGVLGEEIQALLHRRQAVDRQHAAGYWGAEPLLDATSLAHLEQLMNGLQQ